MRNGNHLSEGSEAECHFETCAQAVHVRFSLLLGNEITLEEFFPFGSGDFFYFFFFPPFLARGSIPDPTSRPAELTLPPESTVGKDVLLPPPTPSPVHTHSGESRRQQPPSTLYGVTVMGPHYPIAPSIPACNTTARNGAGSPHTM